MKNQPYYSLIVRMANYNIIINKKIKFYLNLSDFKDSNNLSNFANSNANDRQAR